MCFFVTHTFETKVYINYFYCSTFKNQESIACGRVFVEPNRKKIKSIATLFAYMKHAWKGGGRNIFILWNSMVLQEYLVYT